jgi:hypothetical protein
MEARRQLRALAVSAVSVSADTLHRLVRQATGDERLADKVKAEHQLAEMRAGRTPVA